MKSIKNLGELQKHVEKLIETYGSDSPCVSWLITNKDLTTYADTGSSKVLVSKDIAKTICMNLKVDEYNFIQGQVDRSIRNGLTSQKL